MRVYNQFAIMLMFYNNNGKMVGKKYVKGLRMQRERLIIDACKNYPNCMVEYEQYY